MTKAGQGSSQSLSPRETRARRARRARALDAALFAACLAALAWIVLRGAQAMGYNWQWFRVPRYLWRIVDGEVILGALIKGLIVTLQISALAMLCAAAFGLVTALLRLSRSPVGRALAYGYIEIARNTPLLLQVLVFYFIIAYILGISRFWAGVLSLAFYEGAFAAEIIRGGVLAVRKGQWEAARSLGLGPFDTYRDVILPQALPLMLPPMAGVLVNLVKHSSIVSAIAIFDLTTEGRTIVADTFMAFEIWLTVAGIYLVITLSLSLAVAGLERRYGFARGH
ncbi:MAG: amino acid ABC transporter permease [Methylobacteriaceae bacterium]|nr:amino acid ABC transporter permease [Methylobacteriaceae bacterium]